MFLIINFPSEGGGGGGGGNDVGSSKGRGKKRTAAIADSGLKDFTIEYAKSSRSTCRGCEEKIMKVIWEQQLLRSSISKCYFVVSSSWCVECCNDIIWLTQFVDYTHLFQCLWSVDLTPSNK